jgi:hypothetical protein
MPRTSQGTYLCIAGFALLSVASAARAQLNTTGPDSQPSYPWYLGASLGRTHDSNVFRLPDTLGPRGDSYTTAGILAGLDKPIGRQRLYADVTLRRQQFDELSELDNNGYGLNTGLDWETVEQFSGQLKFGADKSLASYGSPFATTALRERNILKERSFDFTVQHGTVANRLQPFAAYSNRHTDYSASAFQFRDNNRHALRAGVRWRPSDRLMMGMALVEARGKYPNSFLPDGTIGTDKYKSHGIELLGDWTLSGASSLNGRIGYEQRKYTEQSRPDFNGLNGLLRWRWQPTGKLMLTTSLVRDADDTERFLPATGTDLTAAGSRVTNSLILEGTWNATAKVSLNATYRYSDRKLVTPGAVPGVGLDRTGSDKTRYAGLGVNWAATNNLSVGCNVSRQSRSTDTDLSYPFKANTVGCQVQALLR